MFRAREIPARIARYVPPVAVETDALDIIPNVTTASVSGPLVALCAEDGTRVGTVTTDTFVRFTGDLTYRY